ncbi:MAG TPA: Glu/Leu/Phe/Val dehydrogenase dimerization domain-containing protein [Actinomycetes bacterium]|jgi:leucine dehydrogenase|nr:Glu/Leu/Phe/Val dehydrogenase dimerization domain-containing protein [Actinomycetes bacterium]
MGAFGLMGGEYEQVVYNHDPVSGLKAIIAIHSTALGPALGGTRFYPYGSEDDALADVLRLARGMSYKAAVAGLNLGGGKAVILGDPKRVKSEALLRAYGRFVQSLGGRYITAEDVGTYISDMDVVALETSFVTGRSPANGGGGDPSINTAYGVLKGMQAVAEELWNEHDLAGRHVVVQGVGKVGMHLCRLLHAAGAQLTIADLDVDNVARAVKEFGADTVEPGKAHAVECDIFAPCALGAVVNDDTLPELKCAAVAGSANNVLARDEHGYALRQLGILYAPDYVINAGGLINVADELRGYSAERAKAKVEGIFGAVRDILHRAKAEGIPTSEAADRMARDRMRDISRLRLIRVLPGVTG